ncbi:UNVERIFIED_CONTAM: hypothetical protein PYX00_000225 [Menopon gallinae]|uniref:Uncharacterized protein n=1 Tax=Menopon gallinae TaxID=328185 RepID=A0AAW2I860_9NEOP
MKLLNLFAILFISNQNLQSVWATFPDQDLALKIKDALDTEEFVIAFKHIKPKKRLRNSLEMLLELNFSKANEKLYIFLDRKSEKVIAELNKNGKTETESFQLNAAAPVSVIRSLLFAFNQKNSELGLTLYHDCVKKGTVHFPETFKAIVDHAHLEAFREKHYLTEVYYKDDLTGILEKNNCLDEGMQSQQPYSNDPPNRRGDIPVFIDCDDRDSMLAKTINSLIELIKLLRQDIEYQRGEIRFLRSLLERCDICAIGGGASQVRSGCQSHPPPCFHGVECRDTVDGPQCGRCPRGYVGDGRTCKPGITCEEQPCYPGVRCYDTVEGFRCGPCPSGTTGDGQRCRPRGGCERNPCYPGAYCEDTEQPPYYRCGGCPVGMTGNGTSCRDIDEGYRKYRRP